MAIPTFAETEALLARAHAVRPHPRLPLGLIVWKDDQGRPVASARCEAILRLMADGLRWCAGDEGFAAQGVPTVPIPHGLPPRQPMLPLAAARGLAELAVKGGDAELIVTVEHDGGTLFLAIYGFAQGPPLSERTPTEEVPQALAEVLATHLARPAEPPPLPDPEPLPPLLDPAPPLLDPAPPVEGVEPPAEPEATDAPAPEARPAPSPAQPSPVVGVRVEMGPRQELIAISLEVGAGWMDTGLDPVQLATRPVLIGFDVRMLWAVDGVPVEEPVPHLAFRHVADGSEVAQPPFRYAPSPSDPPVAATDEVLHLGDSSRLRFPALPGRIEVKILQVDCPVRVVAYQGYLRIMAMVHRAGPQDIPHKHGIDHIRVQPWEPGFEIPERLPDPANAAPVTRGDW